MSEDLALNLSKTIGRRLDPNLLSERPAPFSAEWSSISPEDSIELLSRVTRVLIETGDESPWPLTHEALALRSTPLSFYDDALLVDVVLKHYIGLVGHASFIVFEDKVCPLTNNSTEIHEINDEKPPKLETPEDVCLYLKLFCWIVCGNRGPFSIVDTPENLEARYDEETQAALKDFFFTVQPKPDPKQPGYWLIEAPIYYDCIAYTAEFLIDPLGFVKMLNDELTFEFGPEALAWQLEPPIRYVKKDS